MRIVLTVIFSLLLIGSCSAMAGCATTYEECGHYEDGSEELAACIAETREYRRVERLEEWTRRCAGRVQVCDRSSSARDFERHKYRYCTCRL